MYLGNNRIFGEYFVSQTVVSVISQIFITKSSFIICYTHRAVYSRLVQLHRGNSFYLVYDILPKLNIYIMKMVESINLTNFCHTYKS